MIPCAQKDPCCLQSADRGYTLIEVVLALAVLSIITGVMVHSFLEVIAARRRVSAEHSARLAVSRVAARSWLGESALEVGEDESADWNVEYRAEEVQSGKSNIVWHSWTLTPSNLPTHETILYLRAGSGKK